MRRILFTVLASGAMFAAVPTAALAQHNGHHRAHHRQHARHHATVRHLRFVGHSSSPAAGSPTSGTPTSGTPTDNSGNAGTVTSFANNILTITLNDAQHTVVTGTVTQDTQLKCEMSGATTGGDTGDDNGDNSGSSSSGDQGGHGDNGGDNSSNTGGDNGDNGDNGDDNGDNANGNAQPCMPTAGMVVHDASLTVSSAGSIWNEVDLITS
jgi:hypothetical protein